MDKQLLHTIKAHFVDAYQKEPVLIASPGRINLIGEHTDYNNGFVLPAAIDKTIIIAGQKNNSTVCNCVAIDLDEKVTLEVNQNKELIQGHWSNYIIGVLGELQKIDCKIGGIDIAFGGNIPLGAGLSSSAALENGIVALCNELFELGLSKEEMIQISQKAEHHYVGVQCGIMDQYASMFGKEDTAILLDCKTLEAKTYPIAFKDYELLLINTNVKHSLADSAYNDRRATCEAIAKRLGKTSLREVSKKELATLVSEITTADYEKAVYVLEENERVLNATQALDNDDMITFGKLMYASHQGLKEQYQVSCLELDTLIDKAKTYPEILGARMMGGGFGGCTINLIHKNHVEHIAKEITTAYKMIYGSACEVYRVSIGNGTQQVFL